MRRGRGATRKYNRPLTQEEWEELTPQMRAYIKKNYPEVLVDIDYEYRPRAGPRVVNEGVRLVTQTPTNEPLPPTVIVRYAMQQGPDPEAQRTARTMVQRGIFNRPAMTQLLQNPAVQLAPEEREFLERARELMNGRIQTFNVTLQTTRRTNYQHLQRGILRFINSKRANNVNTGGWIENENEEYSLRLVYRDPNDPNVSRMKTVTGKITEYHLTLDRLIALVAAPQFLEMVSAPLQQLGGTDPEASGYMVDPTTFTLARISVGTGGEPKSNAYRTIRFTYCTAKSYTGRNGDCLLMCIKKHLNLKGTTNQMRNALADRLPEGAISIHALPMLEDFYQINIDVFLEGELEYEVVETRDVPDATKPSQCRTIVNTIYPVAYIRQNDRYGSTLQVLLRDDHYHHISKMLPPAKLCQHCGRDNCYNTDDCRRYLIANNRLQRVDHKNPTKIRSRVDIAVGLSREAYTGELEPLIFSMLCSEGDIDYYGCDAAAKLVDELCLRRYDGDIIVANLYGGAEVGWYAVLKELIRRGQTPPNSKMFIADGRILQLRFENLCCWDLNQFLPKPLTQLAHELSSSLRVPTRYQKGYPLNAEQQEELRLIVKEEVTFLSDVTDRFCDIIQGLTDLDPTNYPTMASMAYRLWKKGLAEGIYLPPADDKTDTFIRRAMVGGRVQCMYGAGAITPEYLESEVKDSSLTLVDCNSLYPFVMAEYEYPAGDERWTDKEVDGAMAMYRCQVNQDNLEDSHKVLPVRNHLGRLDWRPKGTHEMVITNVDLALLREMGCEVTVLDGVYWPSQGRPFKEYLEKFQQAKEKVSGKYDPSVDDKITVMICKLMMNLLTGKLVQKRYERSWCLARSADDLTRFQRQHYNISVDEIKVPDGAGMVLKLEGVKKYQYNPKTATLVQLGTFIYSYARSYMYRTVYTQTSTFYTDTDSALIPTSHLQRLPIGNKFGEFKIEMDDINLAYLVGAKCYYLSSPSPSSSSSPSSPSSSSSSPINTDEVPKAIDEVPKVRDEVPKARGEDELREIRMRFKGVDTHCEWYPDGATENSMGDAVCIETHQGLNEDLYLRLLQGENVNCICLRLSHNLSGDEHTEVATVKEVYVTQKFGKGGQLITTDDDSLSDDQAYDEDYFSL